MAITGVPVAGIVTPAAQQLALSSNYLDLRTTGWAQQYLPELYEAEVEKYGDRSIGGFLDFLSAEEAMASDEVIWSEQGRLHLAYNCTVNAATGVLTAIKNIDSTSTVEAHAVRKGATIVLQATGGSGSAIQKCVVTEGIETATDTIKVLPYGGANLYVNSSLVVGDTAMANGKFFVYGSEFAKGTDSMTETIEPNFQSYSNRPMIIKDHFQISGSDAAQIGWVEVSGEAGQNGYLWYIKSEADTRKRFEDYVEMAMIEAEKDDRADTALNFYDGSGADAQAGVAGSEGLFSSISKRGLVATDMFDTVGTLPTSAGVLYDFTTLLKELDRQGAIEENSLFLDRTASINMDDALGQISAGNTGGVAYGLFDNSEDMALNLGFTGFRRGSYDFYKTDWKYLNDASTRGHVGSLDDLSIQGVLVPAGTSSVYDQNMGRNIRRPFLHVRYRASATDNRKMKSWVTGSVGATTSGIDKMEIHYLSERCLVTQAANNFVLFKK